MTLQEQVELLSVHIPALQGSLAELEARLDAIDERLKRLAAHVAAQR